MQIVVAHSCSTARRHSRKCGPLASIEGPAGHPLSAPTHSTGPGTRDVLDVKNTDAHTRRDESGSHILDWWLDNGCFLSSTKGAKALGVVASGLVHEQTARTVQPTPTGASKTSLPSAVLLAGAGGGLEAQPPLAAEPLPRLSSEKVQLAEGATSSTLKVRLPVPGTENASALGE